MECKMACDENYRHNDSHIYAIFMQVSEHPGFSPLKLRVLTIKMNVQKLRIKKIAPAWFLMLSPFDTCVAALHQSWNMEK